ncbi:hypothetical protein AX16_006948 [Volvariella volvacea WC 439]|nr:hypothetical protein AX16_006948 [Volvariella volvacea WC 439]
MSSIYAIRRRRFIIFTLIAFIAFLFLGRWELPERLKDSGLPQSRDHLLELLKFKEPDVEVDEIYGLLHLVMRNDQHSLSNVENLDPSQPIDLSVYAGGASIDWQKEVKLLHKKYPLVVFSKTLCPYSKRATLLLGHYTLSPPARVVQVDRRDDGHIIKSILTRLTNHSTFPNVIIKGRTIGGSDNLMELHTTHKLTKVLEKAGMKVGRKVD